MDGVYDNDVDLAEEGYGDNVYAVDYTDYDARARPRRPRTRVLRDGTTSTP